MAHAHPGMVRDGVVMIARLGLLLVLGTASVARAEDVPVELATLGASAITLHLHPFMTEEEMATLRLVMVNEQALSLFVPDKAGFAALAVSPEDGFIRMGAPMGSATAVGGLADAEAARGAALAGCEAMKQGTAPCVTVLEIAPVP
jgi:hypothetical protein